MGQYYKAITIDNDGELRAYNPQNALYMTKNGIEHFNYNDPKQDGYWELFNGMKLMEHSWLNNHFVNGVLGEIEDEAKVVAWVGDYADDPSDYTRGYTEELYGDVWAESSADSPFKTMPESSDEGFLWNVTKNEYIDIARYEDDNTHDGWCIHPLPLLTVIGNGRGGGDYHGTCMPWVGYWAMDEIRYICDNDESLLGTVRDITGSVTFEEGR